MVQSGLEVFLNDIPQKVSGKKAGILCHAASVIASYSHILDVLQKTGDIKIEAIFGPQHGLFGQTQDNMVEWEGGFRHTVYSAPVYSLYGKTRKPTAQMMEGLELFIIDLQDVGARPYTYIWTVKLCMESCVEHGIPVWILDRPNPIAAVPFDGPLLREDYFSFVGGAGIPLCHRMTIGEIALLLKKEYFPSLDLNVVWMNGWQRDSLFNESGLPWVIPSPNMPSIQTAIVYPGMVLFEATNISEARGTTIPFELFGAPYINTEQFKKNLYNRKIPGCIFREHGFIPTFQKWQGTYCNGLQIHVTNPRMYQPVFTAVSIIEAILQTSDDGACTFIDPPYEYENEKMPFDILAGDSQLRTCLINDGNLSKRRKIWQETRTDFLRHFKEIAHYPEKAS